MKNYIEYLSGEAQDALSSAFSQARHSGQPFVEGDDLFAFLISQRSIRSLLSEAGVNLSHYHHGQGFLCRDQDIHPGRPDFYRQNSVLYNKRDLVAPGLSQSLEGLLATLINTLPTPVGTINIFSALINDPKQKCGRIFSREQINAINVITNASSPGKASNKNQFNSAKIEFKKTHKPIFEKVQYKPLDERRYANLTKFCEDLSLATSKKAISEVVGRDDELTRTYQVLMRKKKNNPILVGEPGVGKTAIAEALAVDIAMGQAPTNLKKARVLALDMGSLVAGTTYRGDFEERMKSVLTELRKLEAAGEEPILFIDEIHMLLGAGSSMDGNMDAANMLKPSLADGTLRCIGATTYDEYRKYFQKDAALDRRFQKIDISEPSQEQTRKILFAIREQYEHHHGVSYTNAALDAAVQMTGRYLNDRFFPDKAIDAIDEAGARRQMRKPGKTRLSGEHKRGKTGAKVPIVDVGDIEQVVSYMANIPSAKFSCNELKNLLCLEDNLSKAVFEQNHAIKAISQAVRRAKAQVRINQKKPIGTFLFAGPTGVGKTEVTKKLGEVLSLEIIRFDMSEYMEKHAVARLIGAPPGYVGFDQAGLLTEPVRRAPHSIILLDEIEKAHPDVFNLLLQVLDDGRLTDNNGKVADFSNTIVIMTTNVGAREMEKTPIGFSSATQRQDNNGLQEAIKALFSPEFRNRIDEIVEFQKLSEASIKKVVKKFLDQLVSNSSNENRKIAISISDTAVGYLAQNGFDRLMGARPMQRLIERTIGNALSEEILSGRFKKGGEVCIDVKDNELTFIFNQTHSKVSNKNFKGKVPQKGRQKRLDGPG